MGMEDSVVLYHRIQEVKSKAIGPKMNSTYIVLQNNRVTSTIAVTTTIVVTRTMSHENNESQGQ